MRITEINTVVKTIEYAGEIFINLQELYKLLKTDCKIEMEECLVTPYYIQDDKRMELYQYEFCCTGEMSFEEYLLRLTGKKNIEDIPGEIFRLRRNCFSICEESDRLAVFLDFLFGNKTLEEEIERVFGDYNVENLYAVTY